MEKTVKNTDLAAWEDYRKNPTPENRSALLRRMGGIINAQVNKWQGTLPRGVLMAEAKVLAAKSFDTYDPSKGAALSTHVTNNLLPLSRSVYTYQNAARIPENLTLKINAYNTAVNDYKSVFGAEPTDGQLRKELGYTQSELDRLKRYNVRDLSESGSEVSGSFYGRGEQDDSDDDAVEGLYSSLSHEDRKLLEYGTGLHGKPVLGIDETAEAMGLTRSQVAYKKNLLRKKITDFMNRPSLRRRYGNGSD